MKNYTPGPWKVMFSIPEVGECALAVWPADTVHGCVGSPICKVSPEHLMNETDEANARLIAAAPELLEALVELTNVYDTSDFDIVGKDEVLIKKCKAIIAKATGEKEGQS